MVVGAMGPNPFLGDILINKLDPETVQKWQMRHRKGFG